MGITLLAAWAWFRGSSIITIRIITITTIVAVITCSLGLVEGLVRGLLWGLYGIIWVL